MPESFIPKLIGGICKFCKIGELHQFQEDPQGQLRCGRCGEPAATTPKTTGRQKAAPSIKDEA